MPTGPISAKSVCSVGTIVYEWLRGEEIRIRLKNLKQLKLKPAPVVDIYFVPVFPTSRCNLILFEISSAKGINQNP